MYRRTIDHLPVQYRPEWADRTDIPADVCGFCSDFASGLLVPVSFCPQAWVRCEQEYAYVERTGPEPDWFWLRGPDASSQTLL